MNDVRRAIFVALIMTVAAADNDMERSGIYV